MILELIKAAALLLALSLLYRLIVRCCQNYKIIQQLMAGLLFGGICVIGMMLPIEVHPGVIFDPRSVVLSMAGLFGGPIVAAVSAVIAGGYRLWIGGGGVYVGVAVVISCSALGLTYRYAQHKGWVKVGLLQLLVFGVLVHAVEILLFTALPADVVETVINTVALPLILTFTPATAFLGLLLKDLETRFKTEAALVESENRLTSHLENTPLAAISFDDKFRYTGWNKAATQMFGYTADEVLGKYAVDLLVPDHIHTDINKTFQSVLDREGGYRGINENITRDGRIIICQWYNTPIIDKDGKSIGVDSLAEDITALMQAQEEIKLKNTLLVTQQEASIDGIFALDEAGKIISINQRFIDLWQIPSAIVESNSRDNILQSLAEKVVDTKQFMDRMYDPDEHRNDSSDDQVTLKDGRIVECYSAPLFGQEQQYFGRVWWFRDITARKQAEELIWKQANFDPLTGLANRQLLYDRLLQEIKIAKRSEQSIALLFLDLDQFKEVNDSFGHDKGDSLLIEAANRLRENMREADTIARLGGDEFTIIMGGLHNTSNVERIANEVLRSMSEPFLIGDETVHISTSIGITFYPQDAENADEMIVNADQAMYAAKKRGRNCFQFFTKAMQSDSMSRMLMIKELRSALPENQFLLHYQPIVELASGSIRKAEALIRWQHPSRGLVAPVEFIPIAEETRMIIEIGDWVFREAARQSCVWRSVIDTDFQVSVNTSPVQFQNENSDITDWVTHLAELGLSGDAIAVEITEGLLIETIDMITDKLLMFRDAGIQVSLDDFGTGYSSLSYLQKLDIDYLKIDRSFVQNLKADSDDMALCEAIIVMAHKLGLKVVAEGIETQQQCDLLTDVGCDYGQGYLFSKPVPAEEFELLLSAQLTS